MVRARICASDTSVVCDVPKDRSRTARRALPYRLPSRRLATSSRTRQRGAGDDRCGELVVAPPVPARGREPCSADPSLSTRCSSAPSRYEEPISARLVRVHDPPRPCPDLDSNHPLPQHALLDDLIQAPNGCSVISQHGVRQRRFDDALAGQDGKGPRVANSLAPSKLARDEQRYKAENGDGDESGQHELRHRSSHRPTPGTSTPARCRISCTGSSVGDESPAPGVYGRPP